MENEAGFTLLEVLLAITILAVGFTVLAEGFFGVIYSTDQNQDYAYVVNWAENKMIEIANEVEFSRQGRFTYDNRTFKWWVDEIYINDSLKKIELNLSWLGQRGKKHYSLSRLVLRQE